MTVSAISSNSYLQNIASSSVQPPSGANLRDAFKSLAQALQSGDLQGAQQAFATIQSAWSARTDTTQTSQNTQPTNGSNSTVQDAFNSLGKALQSGDLQGAQQAFGTLQSTFAAHRGHHRHHHASGGDPTNESSSGAGSTSTGANGVTDSSTLLSAILQQSGSGGINGVTDASTLFSSLLQQLATGSPTGTNGLTDASTLLNALLQQSAGVTGSNTNRSTISVVA